MQCDSDGGVVCSVPGKKSDLWWWWLDSGAAQVKQRDCRTCRVELGWAGQGGPWSLADALQKRRRTVTGKLEQSSPAGPGDLRTRNTDRMSGGAGWDWHSSTIVRHQHIISTLSVSLKKQNKKENIEAHLYKLGQESVLLGM